MKIEDFRIVEGKDSAKLAYRGGLPSHTVARLAYCLALVEEAQREIQNITYLSGNAFQPIKDAVLASYQPQETT